MKLSILLSSYNGSNFVEKQIETIINQTRIPDELILIDDKSKDNGKTWSIFNKYKNKYPYIKCFQNTVNLGYENSFYYNIKHVTGDILLFCDHDDIWHKDKLKIIEESFRNNDASGLLHAISYKIEVKGTSKTKQFKKKNKISYTNKLYPEYFKFDRRFIQTKGEACGLALRMSFINNYKDIWVDGYAHDDFWETMLIVFDKLMYYDYALVVRRIHGHNKTALKKTNIDKILQCLIMRKKICMNILNSNHKNELDKTQIKLIENYIEFSKHRISALQNKSFLKWISTPLYGFKFYNNKLAWIRDLLWIWH